MELKTKNKSLPHKLHCGEKQITKQLTQTPTTFGLISCAEFPGKVVNPKQRLLSKYFSDECHIFRVFLAFSPLASVPPYSLLWMLLSKTILKAGLYWGDFYRNEWPPRNMMVLSLEQGGK